MTINVGKSEPTPHARWMVCGQEELFQYSVGPYS